MAITVAARRRRRRRDRQGQHPARRRRRRRWTRPRPRPSWTGCSTSTPAPRASRSCRRARRRTTPRRSPSGWTARGARAGRPGRARAGPARPGRRRQRRPAGARPRSRRRHDAAAAPPSAPTPSAAGRARWSARLRGVPRHLRPPAARRRRRRRVDRRRRTRLRGWCIHHVTGGAPYSDAPGRPPALRHPAGPPLDRRGASRRRPPTTSQSSSSPPDRRVAAQRSRPLPVLDPNQADAAGDGRARDGIATILATQPHPARLFVRRLDDYAEPRRGGRARLTPQWATSTWCWAGSTASPTRTSPRPTRTSRLLLLARDPAATDRRRSTTRSPMWTDVYGGRAATHARTHAGDPDLARLILDAWDYDRRGARPAARATSSASARCAGSAWTPSRARSARRTPRSSRACCAARRPSGATTAWSRHPTPGPARRPPTTSPTCATRFAGRDGDACRRRRCRTRSSTAEPLLYQLLDRTLHLVPTTPAEQTRRGGARRARRRSTRRAGVAAARDARASARTGSTPGRLARLRAARPAARRPAARASRSARSAG